MGRVLKGLVDQKQDAGTLAQVATSGSYNDLSDTPDLTVYATKEEIITWVDTTLPAGQTAYSIASPVFKTTSRIVQILAEGGGKYTHLAILAEGLFVIEFPSALTAGLPISIGISNATGETPTP